MTATPDRERTAETRTRVHFKGKDYDIPADGVIDNHRHGELFWHLTLCGLVGIPATLAEVEVIASAPSGADAEGARE
jgi:hypothetical protein